jgi:hypothetical protein
MQRKQMSQRPSKMVQLFFAAALNSQTPYYQFVTKMARILMHKGSNAPKGAPRSIFTNFMKEKRDEKTVRDKSTGTGKMPKRKNGGIRETLMGIITPIKWDDDEVTQVALCATDDEEYHKDCWIMPMRRSRSTARSPERTVILC